MKRNPLKDLDPIDKASVPLFIVTMLAEAAVLKRTPVKRTFGDLRDADRATLSGGPSTPDPLVPLGYEAKDTAASLAMLVGNVAISFATASLLQKVDSKVFGKRLTNFGTKRGSLAAAMVLWDLLYYWEHRWMHEVRLFWANHVTHHSSERYNLSTALRQPWSSLMMSWVFLPMPALGFPLKKTMRAAQLNLLYQYWIHTEAVDRLPPAAEAVLNTPSHHRVHHGSNPQYLDKNYGGILIVWDKLFGTFEPEVRTVRYGLTKNISTHNPLRIGYHEFIDIARDVRRATGLRTKLHHAFGRPGWSPAR